MEYKSHFYRVTEISGTCIEHCYELNSGVKIGSHYCKYECKNSKDYKTPYPTKLEDVLNVKNIIYCSKLESALKR